MLGTVSDRRVVVCNIHLQSIQGPEYERRRFEQIEEALVALERFAETHQPHNGCAQLHVLLGDFNIDTSIGVPPRLTALLVRSVARLTNDSVEWL